MRILVYVEPHPIRGEMTHFADVAKSFLPFLRTHASIDVRLYANNPTLERIDASLTDAIKTRIIKPTDVETEFFNSYAGEWDVDRINAWVELVSGEGLAQQYVHILKSIWNRYPFDAIVYWGGNGAIKLFAEEYDITPIAMELGCTRAPFLDSLVMDPRGSNGHSLVSQLSIEDIKQAVDGEFCSAKDALFSYSEDIQCNPYNQQFDAIPATFFSKSAERVAFIPLQLYDDANLLVFSNYGSVKDFVLDVVPKLVDAGYFVIIKEHPGSKFRKDGNLENTIAKNALNPWMSSIAWLDAEASAKISNPRLISYASLVVCVNSSVGFESLYYDKPVVIMGRATYAPKGFLPSLDEFLSNNFDREAYLRNCGYVRQFFLGAYLINKKTSWDFLSWSSRVKSLVHLARKHGSNNLEIAKNYYRDFINISVEESYQLSFGGQTSPGVMDFVSPKFNKPVVEPKKDDDFVNNLNLILVMQNIRSFSNTKNADELCAWLKERAMTEDGFREIITESGLFDPDYYLTKNKDVAKAKTDPLRHFLLHGVMENRACNPWLGVAGLDNIINYLVASAGLAFEGSDSFQEITDNSLIKKNRASIKRKLDKSTAKVAVVAHLYYTDLVPDLLDKLDNIKHDFDLIATIPMWGADQIIKLVKAKYPNAVFCPYPNRGRDIGPFLEILPFLIEKDYTTVLKIQTKKGFYKQAKLIPELGDVWREYVVDSLLRSPDAVNEIISLFESDAEVGMVGTEGLYLSLSKYGYHDQGKLASCIMGANANDEENGFFAGTMFWVRPSMLKPLVSGSLKLGISVFETESGANDGALAHLVERLFGHLCAKPGQTYSSLPTDSGIQLIENPAFTYPIEVKISDIKNQLQLKKLSVV